MNPRCVSELLLRPTSLSRPFNSISSNPIWQRAPASHTPQRYLNTKPPTQSANPQRQSDADTPNPPNPAAPNPFADLLSHDATKPTPPGPSTTSAPDLMDSLISNINPQTGSSRQRLRKQGLRSPKPSSGDDVNAAFARHSFGQSFLTTPAPSPGGRRRALDFDDMTMPDDMIDAGPVAPPPREVEPVYPRLSPSYGRTVELAPEKGRDLVRGLGMLGSLVMRNKIKHDMFRQKFHERPGLKRKRLNSERWRARFKKGFRHVCSRVTELTKKGW